jgi:hypothetical protein
MQKLATKVNIYLEWEKKSQQITNLKKKIWQLPQTSQIQKNNIKFLSINCLTPLYDT